MAALVEGPRQIPKRVLPRRIQTYPKYSVASGWSVARDSVDARRCRRRGGHC